MPKKREYQRYAAVATIAIGTLAVYWVVLRAGTYIMAAEHGALLAPLFAVSLATFWKGISSRTQVWLATACIYVGAGQLALGILGRYNGMYLYVWQWFVFYSVTIIIAGVFLMASALRSVPQLRNLRNGLHAVLWDVTSLKTWKRAALFYMIGGTIGAAGGLFGDLIPVPSADIVFILPSIVLLVWAWHVDMTLNKVSRPTA